MSKIVLDASVVFAVLNSEAGAEKLTPELLGRSVMSTVNAAEVQTKLVRRGFSPDDAWNLALSPIQELIDFNSEHARLAGALAAQTSPLGLSLGDRACIALGLSMNAPIYTAERLWKRVRVGAQIHIIR